MEKDCVGELPILRRCRQPGQEDGRRRKGDSVTERPENVMGGRGRPGKGISQAGRVRGYAGDMDDVDIAGQVRSDEVQPTEEDGSGIVMDYVVTMPSEDSCGVVNLKDNVVACKDGRLGQER